jgi:hypothetical protein
MSTPAILNVHTPTSSLTIPHSCRRLVYLLGTSISFEKVSEDSLKSLYDKLTRKVRLEYNGARVGAGWLRYSWNDTVWNLDDGALYRLDAQLPSY